MAEALTREEILQRFHDDANGFVRRLVELRKEQGDTDLKITMTGQYRPDGSIQADARPAMEAIGREAATWVALAVRALLDTAFGVPPPKHSETSD